MVKDLDIPFTLAVAAGLLSFVSPCVLPLVSAYISYLGRWHREFGLTYPNGPDPYNRISKAYRTTGVPETFFIASDGQVTGQHVGPIGEAQLQAALEEVLHP